ncbi:MAG: oligosaccharide flippase family protein [Candidatus Pacearchaeota archaeon]
MIKKTYHKHKETINNFTWRALQIGGKQGITFLIFILTARLLEPYTFGIYNYILAIVFFLVMFADFGISTSTSKYVAEYNVTDKGKLSSILFSSGVIILALTVVITISTILIGPYYFKENYIYIIYVLPLLFLIPLTSLYDGIYRGLKRFKSLAIISMTVGSFSLIFIYILINKLGLIGALISQNLFYLFLALGLGLGYTDFKLKINSKIIKSIGYYALLIGIINFSYFLYTKIDLIIFGKMGLITELGYYEIINRFLYFIAMPLSIFAQIKAPRITSQYYRGKKKEILRFFKKYTKYAIIFATFISIISFFILPLVIKMILPQYYVSELILVLRILLFVFIFQNVAGFFGTSFVVPTGYAKLNMINLIIFGVINIILDYVFLSTFGFIGIVFTKLIVGIASSITLTVFYYRALKKEIK